MKDIKVWALETKRWTFSLNYIKHGLAHEWYKPIVLYKWKRGFELSVSYIKGHIIIKKWINKNPRYR